MFLTVNMPFQFTCATLNIHRIKWCKIRRLAALKNRVNCTKVYQKQSFSDLPVYALRT